MTTRALPFRCKNLEPADNLAHHQTYFDAVDQLGVTIKHPGDWQEFFEKPNKYLNNRFEYFYNCLESRGLIEHHPERPELFKVRPLRANVQHT